MNTHRASNAHRLVLWRPLAGFLGIATAAILMAAVVALFGEASSTPWLEPTPANLARMQRCDGVTGPAAHRACVESVIAAVLNRDRSLQLATIEPAPGQAKQAH